MPSLLRACPIEPSNFGANSNFTREVTLRLQPVPARKPGRDRPCTVNLEGHNGDYRSGGEAWSPEYLNGTVSEAPLHRVGCRPYACGGH
jgi:hypothetical protein